MTRTSARTQAASASGLPVACRSVWATGQRDLADQLQDSSCVLGTETDADLIPPAVARHAIVAYTGHGDLVVDPDCGAGTVLNEALRAGRHATGLTAHRRWWRIARANITVAKRDGALCDGSVLDVRSWTLAAVQAAGLVGRADLVLTSLRVETSPAGRSPRSPETVIGDLATTLNDCASLLRSDGYLVVVARPRRYPDGSLADLTTSVIDAGTSAGLVVVDRCVALSSGLRGNQLITRTGFTERRAAARRGATNAPAAFVAHHEVLVFQLAQEVEHAVEATGITWSLHRPHPTADRSVGRRAA